MPVYVINSFRGLSDYGDKGIAGAFKFGSNLDVRKTDDSLTCEQALEEEGIIASQSASLSVSPSGSLSFSPSLSPSASASPTPSPSASISPSLSGSLSPSTTGSSSISLSPSVSTSITSVFRDLPIAFVKGSDGYTYGFGNTGYVYRRDADAFWERVYKDANGAIKGAAEWYSNKNKTYLFWATNNKLHRKELPGLSNWNDVNVDDGWPKQNLNSADWHTMREAGGALMIANGPWLAMVGWDQSYTNEALNLIPGNVAKTIVERNGRTIVGTARLSDPNKSINAAIDTEVPLAQVGDDGQIYFANMSDSLPVKTFPGGGKCNPYGVTNKIDQVNFFEWEQTALSWIDKQAVGNLALFAVYDANTDMGGIYSYGRDNKNHPFTLNLDHQFDADELGAITNVDGTTLVSYRDGSDFGVKAADPDVKATATYEGLELKSKVKKPTNITNWKYAEIFCEALPNNSHIEFWYKIDRNGEFIQAKMEGGNAQFRAENETQAVFQIQAKGTIFEPRIVIVPIGNVSPEIHMVKIFFD